MKTIVFVVSLLSLSISALANNSDIPGEVLISSVEAPLKFKFKKDILLKPQSQDGVLQANVYEREGWGNIGRGNSCSLKRATDPGVKKVTVRGTENQGVEWTIRLARRENLGRVNLSSLAPELAVMPEEYRPEVKDYLHEFTISNSSNVQMTLTCTHVCSEKTALSRSNKVACIDRLPVGTVAVLKNLGVSLKEESMSVVQQTQQSLKSVKAAR